MTSEKSFDPSGEQATPDRVGDLSVPFIEDFNLMQAVAQGDKEAARQMARRLLPKVQLLCQRLVRDQDPRDLAQSAMLELLRGAGRFRGESSLEQWARRISVRVALKIAQGRRKSLARENPVAQGDIEVLFPAKAAGGTDETLMACLDQLPENSRELLLLRYGLGYAVEEIAAETGLPLGTIKSRLVRGRSELRRLMKQSYLIEEVRGVR